MSKFFLFMSLLMLQVSFVAAQGREGKLSGVVKDAQSEAIPNVTIINQNNPNVSTLADVEGKFSIAAQSGDVLVFRAVGFITSTVTYTNQTDLTVELAVDETSLEQVVVVGYGSMKRRNLTSSIASISGSEVEGKAVVSFDQAIAGKVPGVSISQSNGAPGGGVSVNVRGVGSITAGTSPLYVIDGVPLSSNSKDRFNQGGNNFNYTLNPLNSLNPSDIEDIQILKDAAATAIYGSRGANGVVIISTKKGKSGTPAVSFNSYVGVSKLLKKVDVMDAYELANYMKKARDLSWVNRDPIKNSADDPLDIRSVDDRYPSYMIPYINGEKGLINTDWQDAFYRNAIAQNYDVSISGGTNSSKYYASLGYLNQEGIIPNSGIKRYTARLNLETELSRRVKFGLKLNPTYTDNNLARSEKNWGDEGLVIGALMYHPNMPVYNADGSYAVDRLYEVLWSGESNVVQFQNPLALANMVQNRMNQYDINFSANLDISIFDNLKFKTLAGGSFGYNDRKYYRPKSLSYRTEPAPTSYFNFGEAFNATTSNMLWDNSLEFNDNFNGHDVNVVVGTSIQRELNKNSVAEGRDFATDNVTTINTSQDRYSNEQAREWRLLSYFARGSYAYNGKYLFMGTIRADGSSKFGKQSKWGVFPSVSAAWRISEEQFFANDVVDDLKLRASYGVTGNNDIPYYGSMALLSTGGKYPFGNSVVGGLYPSSAPNEELSWETTKTIDFGLEARLWGKLNLTFDYYDARTKDLLLNVPVPGSSGYTQSLQNIGRLSNKGFEFGANMTHDFNSDHSLSVSVNVSRNINKVLELGPGQNQIISSGGLADSHITRIGNPIGSYFGYNIVGRFDNEEQLKEHAKLGKQAVGDFIYQDTNGDGVVNADDRVILGSNLPKYEFGFNVTYKYKNLDFTVGGYSKQGFQVLNSMHRYLAEAWGNNLSAYLSPDAARPVWGVGSGTHTRASSWQIEEGSFIRIREITIGYRLPQEVLSKIKIQGLRVYTSANNPFTWTKYSGYNPEVSSNFGSALTPGEEFGNYPISRSFNVGINLNF